MKKTIGIIGFGNMGRAIAEQLKGDYRIFVFDKDRSKLSGVAGLEVAQEISLLAGEADALILAVKPQDFQSLLDEISQGIKDKLIISIAAGITTGYIEKKLSVARVIRAMPNMPATIGAGMTCLCKGKSASEDDLDFAEDLFVYLGEVIKVGEDMMNAATAVSGSGPGYVCDYLEAESIDPRNIPEQKKEIFLKEFQGAAESVGFTTSEAGLLVNMVFSGTVEFIKETGISCAELKKKVISKGGTTEAALLVRRNHGSWEEVVKAALKRAEELSRGA